MGSNSIAVSDNNLALESSTLLLPNKSDSGVEGATSSLDTPLPLLPTPDKEDNYSNNNNMIYTNNSQANSLSNTYTSSSSPKYNNQTPNKSPRGKHYNNNNNNNNRGGLNRRGSFNRRWRGPGYSSDYQPSPITENNSSPGRASEYNTKYKHTCKVGVQFRKVNIKNFTENIESLVCKPVLVIDARTLI